MLGKQKPKHKHCFIEVFFDPELDNRWHCTEWFYKTRSFNPMQAAFYTHPESWENVRQARTWGSSQRLQRMEQGYEVLYRVTPLWQTMITAVIRKAPAVECDACSVGAARGPVAELSMVHTCEEREDA